MFRSGFSSWSSVHVCLRRLFHGSGCSGFSSLARGFCSLAAWQRRSGFLLLVVEKVFSTYFIAASVHWQRLFRLQFLGLLFLFDGGLAAAFWLRLPRNGDSGGSGFSSMSCGFSFPAPFP